MDRVVITFVMHHLPSPIEAAAEALRVTRRGGRVGTVNWVNEMESAATRLWSDCLDEHRAAESTPAVMSRHEQVDSPGKMDAIFRGAGASSVRSWEEDLLHELVPDHLIRLRTSMGSLRPRFESLASSARAACLAAARSRMSAVPSAGFLAKGRIVYTVAER